jgi:hypothetical protein
VAEECVDSPKASATANDTLGEELHKEELKQSMCVDCHVAYRLTRE